MNNTSGDRGGSNETQQPPKSTQKNLCRHPNSERPQKVTTPRTVIHDRRIEIAAPENLADGTEVILTIGTDVADDDGPMSPAEIARVLAAMRRLQPLEIPHDVAAELDAGKGS